MEDVGKPLFLTSYLEANSAEEARRAAAVEPKLCGIPSYSGFLTVEKSFNSNLFFWYFPAAENAENAPVVFWTNGWNSTCLSGLFNEHGPYSVAEDRKSVSQRPDSWHKICHIVYLDATVSNGFSFTEKDEGYRTDQEDIGKDLYTVAVQFFHIFPELKRHELYIAGISYSGKFSTSLAYCIDEHNSSKEDKFNLKGVIYINPFMVPTVQTRYGDFLQNLGLIDDRAKSYFDETERKVVDLMEREEFCEAGRTMGKLLLFGENTYFHSVSGIAHPYHLLRDAPPSEDWMAFVQLPQIRKLIHVGDRAIGNGVPGVSKLLPDLMKSVKHRVELLLERYRVLIISGQLDIICGYPMLARAIDSFDWSGKEGFKNCDRRVLKSDGQVDGYIRNFGNLTEVMVTSTGHMASTDQPRKIMEIVGNFLYNKSSMEIKTQ